MNRSLILCSVVLAALTVSAPVLADGPADGRHEVSGSLSYNDVEDTSLTLLNVSYGRYLTDMHQVGLSAAYLEMETTDFYMGEGSRFTVDGTLLGAFYRFNFPTDGALQPYVGVNFATIGGDLGDAYDGAFGATLGLKVMPFRNAGIDLGVSRQRLQGAGNLEDSDLTSFNVGLLMRF